MVYVEVTEKRYQEAIRDRMIVEMIKKICSEDRSYILKDMAEALLDASDECRKYEAEVEAYPSPVLPFNKN